MNRQIQPLYVSDELDELYTNTNIFNTEISKEDELYYVFHGNHPSILDAGVFFRIIGNRDHRDFRGRKIINCPYCQKPLTDVAKTTKVELHRNPAHSRIDCHSYPKCKNCKNEVGMIIKKVN